jgi:hypothetical protein
MPRLSKKEKRERLLLVILVGIAVGLLLILGVRVIAPYSSDGLRAIVSWFIQLAPKVALLQSVSLSSSSFSSTAPAATEVPPLASSSLLLPATTPALSSATYTELFSGIGFDDVPDTTAYEDHVATTISLVPDFSVSPTSATFTPALVMPAAVPASENLSGATVTQNGQIYTANIPAFPDLVVTSSYAGILRFGYDPSTQKTLVVYAAYESRVLEMGPTGADGQIGLLADYSTRFGAAAFAGSTFGARGVAPVVFSQDGAWWIFSGEGSTKPKLMKIQNGVVTDYTKTAFPDEVTTLIAAPGPASHEIYVEDSLGSYILTDNGFKQTAAQWVSSKLNQWDGNVAQGEITSVDESAGAAGVSASIPSPSYFLSNDGGTTWVVAMPGDPVTFSTSGSDFRFKAELSPAAGVSADPYATPWVHIVRLEYWVARSAL